LTSIARAVRKRRTCSRIQVARVNRIWPLFALCDQSRTDWILTNVFKFFRQALIMPQPMIEKISLPIDLRHSGRDSLKITNEAGKLRITGNANQHVQVVWHWQKQFQIPPLRRVIAPCRFEQNVRNAIRAKLIYTPTLAANCNEICGAESAVKMQ
jgi:hypothetical protein